MTDYILFLTDYAFRLPQRLAWWQSFDLPKIFSDLRKEGYFPVATHYEDEKLIDLINDLSIKYCIPASSYPIEYRNLINNKLIAISKLGINLIPSLELMLAYENKCLQADLGKILKLKTPQTFEVSTVEKLLALSELLKFPYIVKTSEGYASSGVFAIRNETDQEKIIAEFFTKRTTGMGTSGLGYLQVQEFIPNLEGDWKVIIVDDIAAALYRRVRKNDFRASGSHLFEFREPDIALLSFAYSMKEKLHSPWVSLDIAQKEDEFFLLEFQCTHFGTYTFDNAPIYFQHLDNGSWKKITETVHIEDAMAKGILAVIRK